MAVGLRARYDVAADGDFQKKVAQALVETAVTIYNELNTTQGHAARAAYAVLVATDPPLSMVTNGAGGVMQPDKRTFAVARLLTTQGIDLSSTDAQITAAVATVWNALAGA
jgi:hypothetical protein